jgi:hypothetical protein
MLGFELNLAARGGKDDKKKAVSLNPGVGFGHFGGRIVNRQSALLRSRTRPASCISERTTGILEGR